MSPSSRPKEALVFSHHCTVCDRTELIFADQLTALDNRDDGFLMTFECWCGATQTHLVEREVAAA